jgi:Ca-activated chloride channel family protein
MERMRRLDRPVVLTLLFAVLVTAMAGTLHQMATTPGCIELVVVSSLEKSKLLQQAAVAFNTTRRTVGGRCVDVNVEPVASGAAERALVGDWQGHGGARPDVWSPAATTWLALLDRHREERRLASLFVPGTPPSLMQSPLVIAMPEDMARALGWPDRQLGWKSIFELAQDPRGWAAHGQSKWGAFRLGKTNPQLSTSGLNALISTYFAASGKASDLTHEDLQRPTVIDFVQKVESSVVHYGDTVFTFLTNLRAAADRNSSTPYVSAVAVEEKEVWNYNVGNVTGDPALLPTAVPPNPLLAAIYPNDGTLLADHPYVLLNWVTSDKKAASAMFLEHLLAATSQQRFQRAGFRDSQGRSGPEISMAYLLNPAKPHLVLPPTGQVIAAIQASWTLLRKKARVLIVVDVSTSVGAGRLAAIKSPLADALGELAPGDQVGLWQAPGATQTFDELVPVGPLATTRALIRAKIQALEVAKRHASLMEVVRMSMANLRDSYDTKRIDAIVLLSPGTGATATEVDALRLELRNQPVDRSIHVFTVAYGDHPDETFRLSRIALASGAGFYNSASASSFRDLMIQVLSNF